MSARDDAIAIVRAYRHPGADVQLPDPTDALRWLESLPDPAAVPSEVDGDTVRKPVRLIDPGTGKEVAFTAREAAALIVTLQAELGKDEDIDPRTSYPWVPPLDEVLGWASDAEMYAEHTEAHVLPFRYEPHDFVQTGPPCFACEVCGDDIEQHPRAALAATGEPTGATGEQFGVVMSRDGAVTVVPSEWVSTAQYPMQRRTVTYGPWEPFDPAPVSPATEPAEGE